MVKSKNSNDKYKLVAEELEHFEKLIASHRKLLEAIGRL